MLIHHNEPSPPPHTEIGIYAPTTIESVDFVDPVAFGDYEVANQSSGTCASVCLGLYLFCELFGNDQLACLLSYEGCLFLCGSGGGGPGGPDPEPAPKDPQ